MATDHLAFLTAFELYSEYRWEVLAPCWLCKWECKITTLVLGKWIIFNKILWHANVYSGTYSKEDDDTQIATTEWIKWFLIFYYSACDRGLQNPTWIQPSTAGNTDQKPAKRLLLRRKTALVLANPVIRSKKKHLKPRTKAEKQRSL